jgi:hypothetical protein
MLYVHLVHAVAMETADDPLAGAKERVQAATGEKRHEKRKRGE